MLEVPYMTRRFIATADLALRTVQNNEQTLKGRHEGCIFLCSSLRDNGGMKHG